MSRLLIRIPLFLTMLMTMSSVFAVDSYRYAHVTIETPWAIFVFLLLIILFPFVLSAVLYWHFATKKPDEEDGAKGSTDE